MPHDSKIVFAILCVGAVFFAPAALAQSDEDCMFCHGEESLTEEVAGGKVRNLYVDYTRFGKSVHGAEGCVACHADIEELPHAETLEPVDCDGCHDVTEEYNQSLHGVALMNGDKDAAICHDCHSKHNILNIADPRSPVHPSKLAFTCGRCHSDTRLTKRHMVSVIDPSDAYIKSVHGKAVMEKGLDAAATCNDCHGTHDMLVSQDPASRIFWHNIPETCGQCHAGIVRIYRDSIHGQALSAGIKDAPNCTSCHGEHDIESHLLATSATSPQQVSKTTCPRCHDNERMMERYGIATMRQASYMDSYHGMATSAGSDVVADCTSCHNVHDILPSADPRSSTHLDNLVSTCARCHEDAGENFAIGRVHMSATDPDQWILGLVRFLYLGLIAAVVGGIVAHNSLMLGRQAFAKFNRGLKDPKRHRRFAPGLTIGHMFLALSFIVLSVSGFALRYPETWWAQIVFPGDAGLAARGIVHRIAAVVMVVLFVINGSYLLFTAGGRNELRQLLPKLKDVKDVFQNVAYALGLAKTGPKFDRYGYTEKFEYWGMSWGTALMIVTGFCMWFVNTVLSFIPKIGLDVIALIHFYEAWLAILTIIIWHIYYMVFDPKTYPMNWTWVNGYITEEEFKHHHPIEYERVTGKSADEEAGESGPEDSA